MSGADPPQQDSLHLWRHPRAIGVEGRCIGRTDVAVDARKAKRLARRIQRIARAEGLPRIVITSRLRRCADGGRWLRRWGWEHRIDPALGELDFGAWEGRCWSAIDRVEVDGVVRRLRMPQTRRRRVARTAARTRVGMAGARVIVAHSGWMLARLWLEREPERWPTAQQWPAAPDHGKRVLCVK